MKIRGDALVFGLFTATAAVGLHYVAECLPLPCAAGAIPSMAGLYIHIPFCKQACHYCNFHFSTSLHYKSELVAAICREIALQKDYLGTRSLGSVYFGGGTPSLLNAAELESIFKSIDTHFQIESGAEITLEANPDDLDDEGLAMLRDSPVNRLSIGIQSFREADLRYMNRVHTAREAWQSVEKARQYGFDSLSLDLIYGTPGLDDVAWLDNIRQALDLGVTHLSAYSLTVEPKTPLEKKIRLGQTLPPEEQSAARHFELLMEQLEAAGFLHYEISNFARPGHLAVHNTNYWKGVPYLGIGPAAHSFDGHSRQWNIANNRLYIDSIQIANIPAESEVLDIRSRYNEYIMTGLRTMWGVSLEGIASIDPAFSRHFLQEIKHFTEAGHVLQEGSQFKLSRSGKLLADAIAVEVFVA